MGLLKKVEDKLSSHKSGEQHAEHAQQPTTSTYIPPTGTAVNNPAYASNGGQEGISGSSATTGLTGSTKTTATEPYDPYSSAGQKTAAQAVPSVGTSGDAPGQAIAHGQAITHGQARVSYDEHGIQRSAHGGITNSSTHNDRNFISGPTEYMSNSDAIPTAGGRALGDGQSSQTSSSSANSSTQHHRGRDATLAAGGAGAATHGSHAAHDHYGQQDSIRQRTPAGPALASQNYGNQSVATSQQLTGQKAAYGQGAVDAQGAAGDAAAVGSKVPQPSQAATSGSAFSASSGADPKKLGSAYEAGYRDALAHMEAERQRQPQQR